MRKRDANFYPKIRKVLFFSWPPTLHRLPTNYPIYKNIIKSKSAEYSSNNYSFPMCKKNCPQKWARIFVIQAKKGKIMLPVTVYI